jgi:hypothetical protein
MTEENTGKKTEGKAELSIPQLEGIDIDPELREKAKECTSPEELPALAKKEGYKLSDDEMEGVAGGWASGCSSEIWYGTGAV